MWENSYGNEVKRERIAGQNMEGSGWWKRWHDSDNHPYLQNRLIADSSSAIHAPRPASEPDKHIRLEKTLISLS